MCEVLPQRDLNSVWIIIFRSFPWIFDNDRFELSHQAGYLEGPLICALLIKKMKLTLQHPHCAEYEQYFQYSK
jgi:hypothetical protein